ncbi:hypothetical protein GCM10029976_006320 [Kribbella albertanoniae]
MKRQQVLAGGMPMPGLAERIVKAIFLTLICAVVVVPFIGVVSTSLASPEEVIRQAASYSSPPTESTCRRTSRSCPAGR